MFCVGPYGEGRVFVHLHVGLRIDICDDIKIDLFNTTSTRLFFSWLPSLPASRRPTQCTCVRACAPACVRACARTYVRACVLYLCARVRACVLNNSKTRCHSATALTAFLLFTIQHVDGLGHKPSNSEFKKKIHKMTSDQVLHHVQI